jgi:hypothetical protein
VTPSSINFLFIPSHLLCSPSVHRAIEVGASKSFGDYGSNPAGCWPKLGIGIVLQLSAFCINLHYTLKKLKLVRMPKPRPIKVLMLTYK